MPTDRIEPFPLIEIAGTPAARGRAYGEQAKERITRSIAHYKAQGRRLQLAEADLARIIRSYVPMFMDIAPLAAVNPEFTTYRLAAA